MFLRERHSMFVMTQIIFLSQAIKLAPSNLLQIGRTRSPGPTVRSVFTAGACPIAVRNSGVVSGQPRSRVSHMAYFAKRGFSLIEVLVALVIFAIAVLGVMQLHVRGLSTSMDLRQRNVATTTLQGVADRINANTGGIASYLGNYQSGFCIAQPAAQCADQFGSDSNACNEAEAAQFDLWAALCGPGPTGSDGLQSALLDWSLDISCTDPAGDCSTANSTVQLLASWRTRAFDTNQNITDNAVENEQMSLEFVPW